MRRKKIIHYAMTALLWFAVSSCIFEDEGVCPETSVHIGFDWDTAYNAELPAGMAVLFYDSHSPDWWRFDVSSYGGYAALYPGTYSALSFNNDMSTAVVNGYDSSSTLFVTSRETRLADAATPSLKGAPPPRTSEEPVHAQPGTVYSASLDGDLALTGNTDVIFTPRRITPRYRIIFDNIVNASSAAEVSVGLSGMSAGIYMYTGVRSGACVTIPGRLGISGDIFDGELSSFGPAPENNGNLLSLYVWLLDGKKQVFTFDVSDTVGSAPPGADLTIRISGIKLPETHGTGGDMQVGVDNWEYVDIELKN